LIPDARRKRDAQAHEATARYPFDTFFRDVERARGQPLRYAWFCGGARRRCICRRRTSRGSAGFGC
jgi:hypothetical protein